jgi:hypothetical protein
LSLACGGVIHPNPQAITSKVRTETASARLAEVGAGAGLGYMPRPTAVRSQQRRSRLHCRHRDAAKHQAPMIAVTAFVSVRSHPPAPPGPFMRLPRPHSPAINKITPFSRAEPPDGCTPS